MKNVENFNQIIKDLAMDAFNGYPEIYAPSANGLASDETVEAVQELSISYFENRNEDEMARDEELGMNLPEYVESVMSAYQYYLSKLSPIMADKDLFEIFDSAGGWYSISEKGKFGGNCIAGGDSAFEDHYNLSYIQDIFDNWDGTLHYHKGYGFKIAE